MAAGTKKKKRQGAPQLTDRQRIIRFRMLRRNFKRGDIHGFDREVRALERHVRKLETVVPAETNDMHSVYSRCHEELATLKKWLQLAKVWG
uniref:Uncharacterized protein n=1 Tax=bacterium enrichment culture clone fosmid MGS-K1 TaxID=1549356 RepID=A0A0B5KQS3_9BACT|nr:hypothetical protein [bacterium enrichment culture clone fosmid MGS-K1]